MAEKRKITPEEWAEMLAWLQPRLSVGVSDNPFLRALSPQKAARIVLDRLNAQHLTEFEEEWLLRELVRLSGTPSPSCGTLSSLCAIGWNGIAAHPPEQHRERKPVI